MGALWCGRCRLRMPSNVSTAPRVWRATPASRSASTSNPIASSTDFSSVCSGNSDDPLICVGLDVTPMGGYASGFVAPPEMEGTSSAPLEFPQGFYLGRVLDALVCQNRAACPWCMIPLDFPPAGTVRYH